jgi:integrase/recombinase XerD
VLGVTRCALEMYVRCLESRGYAAATVARRFGTVATFYKYAVIDGVIAANPAAAVTRPKVAWEGQKRTMLHPLEFAALLAAARTSGPNDHALACLLGMLGLRVSEACASDITDIRYEGWLRAAARARQGRQASRHPAAHPGAAGRAGGRRHRHHGADLADPDRTADAPSRSQPGTDLGRARRWCHPPDQPARSAPHGLRRTFCTTGLVAGIGIRDMQYAMRHADPRITMRYDMARANLDRHAAHAVAAYLAGMSTG